MVGAWEVEQKYVVQNASEFAERLQAEGFARERTELHIDTYFRHPCRDFRATDEAFRLRRVDEHFFVTYKGQRQAGPVKVRPEIELSLDLSEQIQWHEMLKHLGFRSLPAARKTREVWRAPENHPGMTATIDTVGSEDGQVHLGVFAEIELIVEHKDELEPARERVQHMATSLNLTSLQPLSYLALMLQQMKIE